LCGVNLKQAGLDGVVIQGKADKPAYLYARGKQIFEKGRVVHPDLAKLAKKLGKV